MVLLKLGELVVYEALVVFLFLELCQFALFIGMID